ncbi:Alpha/Beta hydrolase protein [Mycena floridula]|nr:Alpha/Beta hydrolase protein [Mycena floridula]
MSLLTLCFLLFMSCGLSTGRTSVIDLGYSRYQASFDDSLNATHFFGLRYGAAPTGQHRWRAPQAPSFVPDIQSADSQPPSCPQGPPGGASSSPFTKRQVPFITEDCLFLNVYVPGVLDNTTRRDVLVWIHGGAYIFGSASMFTGDDLLRELGGNAIVVIIQYRLGLFGFLAGTKIKKGGALNAGLLDQQFALTWVQDHIEKFGGDPQKVTIWGQSAGGGSALQHIIANNGQTEPPLFRNAMSSSTYLPSQYWYNARIPEAIYQQVVSQSNCAHETDTLDLLQTVNSNVSGSGFFGTVGFVPVVDGTFIAQSPSMALRQRKVNGDALFAFTNTFEGDILINPAIITTIANYISQLFPGLTIAQVAEAAKLYESDFDNVLAQVSAVMGESILVCPTYTALRAFPGRSFKGEFGLFPARHLDDLPYYFPSMNGTGAPPGIPLAPVFNNTSFMKAFSQSFADFALSSDVNQKLVGQTITPLWPPWEETHEMLFSKSELEEPIVKVIGTSQALIHRCSFWDSVSEKIGQ